MVATQLKPDLVARAAMNPAVRDGLSLHQLNGRRLIRMDFNAFSSELADLMMIEAMGSITSHQPPGSVLTLTLLSTRRPPTPAVVERLKLLARDNKPYVRAAALLGLRPVQRLILNLVMIFSGRTIATFDTEKDALQWLAEQG